MTARFACGWLAALALAPFASAGFIRPAAPDAPSVFGVENGIVVALHPSSLDRRPAGGPRGLFRVGYQEAGRYHLINYVAVEPVVGASLGLSELESGGDGQPGKRFTVVGDPRGRLEHTATGDMLTFTVAVEPFNNGASPVVEVTLFEKRPQRVRFRVRSAGGAEMGRCTLTATMGNQSRCRHLWLKGRAVFAPDLYADYGGTDFVEEDPFPVTDFLRTPAGDAVVAISPDEAEPREVFPFKDHVWHHPGRWMAQYWLKPAGTFDDSLRCRVNGRRVYWGGKVPIPGGTSFENFEVREPFRVNQEVWFGYTTDSPAKAFDFGYDVAPHSVTRSVPPVEVSSPPATGLSDWRMEGGRKFQTFTIPADATALSFRLSGGTRSSIRLWHGEKLHRHMAGRDSDVPVRLHWDVSAFRGKVVTLELTDDGVNADGLTIESGK